MWTPGSRLARNLPWKEEGVRPTSYTGTPLSYWPKSAPNPSKDQQKNQSGQNQNIDKIPIWQNVDQNKRNRDIWTFKLLCNTHNRYKCEKRSLQHIGSEEKKSFSKSLDRMSTQFNNKTNHHLPIMKPFFTTFFLLLGQVYPITITTARTMITTSARKKTTRMPFPQIWFALFSFHVQVHMAL